MTTREGLPLAGAVVMIVGGSTSYPEIAAVADEAGRFRLPCDGPGAFTLLVRTTAGAVWTERIEVRADRPGPVHLILRKSRRDG